MLKIKNKKLEVELYDTLPAVKKDVTKDGVKGVEVDGRFVPYVDSGDALEIDIRDPALRKVAASAAMGGRFDPFIAAAVEMTLPFDLYAQAAATQVEKTTLEAMHPDQARLRFLSHVIQTQLSLLLGNYGNEPQLYQHINDVMRESVQHVLSRHDQATRRTLEATGTDGSDIDRMIEDALRISPRPKIVH